MKRLIEYGFIKNRCGERWPYKIYFNDESKEYKAFVSFYGCLAVNQGGLEDFQKGSNSFVDPDGGPSIAVGDNFPVNTEGSIFVDAFHEFFIIEKIHYSDIRDEIILELSKP